MSAVDRLQQHKSSLALTAGGLIVGGSALYLLTRAQKARTPRQGPFPATSLPLGAYDAVIVGAGPSGSSTAFYLARAGAKVAILDKERFPRDKYCGDAVCTPAIHILTEMGVLQELKDAGEVHFADNGGFVSPSGISYIGAYHTPLL